MRFDTKIKFSMVRFLSVLFVAVFVSVALVNVSQAAVVCPAGYFDTTGAGVCIPTDSGLSAASVSFILETSMKWLLGIFGFLAIIAFVISGVQYLMAAGDDDTISTAKRNMKYSIIGVVVALSGYVIIQAISTALTGTSSLF